LSVGGNAAYVLRADSFMVGAFLSLFFIKINYLSNLVQPF